MTTFDQARKRDHDGAVEALMDAYHAYGQYPNHEEAFLINTIITTYIGAPLSCAQITEALATCHDIHYRRTTKPNLMYHDAEVIPEDDLYQDALADYEHDNEQTLYRIIQEATK